MSGLTLDRMLDESHEKPVEVTKVRQFGQKVCCSFLSHSYIQLAMWVASEVCGAPNIKQRTLCLAKFIDLGSLSFLVPPPHLLFSYS